MEGGVGGPSGDERLLRTSHRLDQSPDDGMMALRPMTCVLPPFSAKAFLRPWADPPCSRLIRQASRRAPRLMAKQATKVLKTSVKATRAAGAWKTADRRGGWPEGLS